MWVSVDGRYGDSAPRLCQFRYPDAYFVPGNIINNPPLGFMHLHMGGIQPFLPENNRPAELPKSWKPSEHGPWRGEDDFEWNMDIDLHTTAIDDFAFKKIEYSSRHQFGRLSTYEVWEHSSETWGITAQQHYFLLDAIEKEELERYMWKLAKATDTLHLTGTSQ